ncbi:MAG: AsmA family protein, partial [Alphaproteobacteria bacterium]|nr:AsmA family protein [Alphaproteobacteria bacterium]
MKKALAGLLGLIAIFVVIALVGPVVVDWNRYKPQIAKQVERATGRQVTIDGDIALSLLPAPTFALEDLRVANTPGAVAPDMLRLKTLEVRIALGALLTGRIRVESIVLVEPHFALEVSPDGRRNWAFQPATGAAMAASDEGGIGLLVGDVTLDRLAIENGTVSYLDVATGTVARAEAVSAEFWARSIRGPFGGRGNFTYRGLQSDFRVALGRLKRSREIPLSMALEVEGASASFEGRFGLEGDVPQVAGRLQLEGENLKQLAASAFGGAVPSQVSKWLPGRPFLLEGDIDGDGRRVTIDDLSVGLGDIRATGAAKLVLDAPLRAEVRLSVGTINLDKLLVEWAAVLPPPVNRGGVFLASTATQTVWPPAPTTGVAIPSGVEGRLDLSVDAIIYRGRVVQNAHLGVVAEAGSLSIADASASLPGGSDFVVTGRLDSAAGKPRFVGGFEARSRHARVLFEWIGANLANLPADRLRTFTLTGDLAGTPDEIGLSNLDLLLDDSRATGAATVALSGRPAIGIDLVLDGLDIDAYMPAAEVGRAVRTTQAEQAPRGGATGETEASPEATPAPESPFAALKMLESFDVNIVARIGSLTVNKQRIKGLELDGRVTEGRVQLDKLAVKDFAGASGQITALLQELASNPTLDASFDLMAPDAARLLKAVGMTPPDSVARAGAMSARGTVKGTAESLKIDAVVTAFAGQALFAGTISDLAAGPGWDLRVDADYPDLRPVLEALGIEVAAGDLGPFAVAGT